MQDLRLQSAACSALYFTAYIAPDMVLPLVYQRFTVSTPIHAALLLMSLPDIMMSTAFSGA